MDGGGSFTSGNIKVTHGFELHCNISELPNNLEINWDKGNNFHLDKLISGACSDNPSISEVPPIAGFDTYVGTGTGTFNNVPGYTVQFTFTDAGEPGVKDYAKIVIKAPDNTIVLSVQGFLTKGNQQAH
jgi:hypothetical protein